MMVVAIAGMEKSGWASPPFPGRRLFIVDPCCVLCAMHILHLHKPLSAPTTGAPSM